MPSFLRRPWTRGALIALGGVTVAFLLIAYDGQLPRGPLWIVPALLVAIGGLLDALGLGRPVEDDQPLADTWLYPKDGEPLWIAPVVTLPVGFGVLFAGASIFGFAGLPWVIAFAWLIPLPAALRRPGLLLLVTLGLLYTPFLGTWGLWDPWETHYGEVAREILARNDWISTWWAQEPGATDGWFFSKPILIFWIEAISMNVLGVAFHSDANPAHPEWAVRLPHVILAAGATMSLYALMRRVWSPRAGLLAGLALVTTPYFVFLAHQAITDMPFVACMSMAMAMLGLALAADPDATPRRVRIGPVAVGLQEVVLAGFCLVVLPQVLYLITRNVALVDGYLFDWSRDRFLFGSAGNDGVPGNARHMVGVAPYFDGLLVQPLAQGLLWLAGGVLVVWGMVSETRTRGFYLFAFYTFCGLAFLGKGIPGFALPGLIALVWLVASRRWDLLTSGRLKVGVGALIVIVVGMPWYTAMTIRHGRPFIQRLLIHDHINRLTTGVHGDNGSIEYFIEQLGYGLFPWLALAPLGLALWTEGTQAGDVGRRRRETLLLLSLWLASAFTLFSGMTTKFHHYIFPAVPAAMMLVGLVLDRLWGAQDETVPRWRRWLSTGLALASPLPLVIGVAGRWGDVRGALPEGAEEIEDWVLRSEQVWSSAATTALIALGVALFAAAWWLGRETAQEETGPRWRPAALTTGLFAGPALALFAGRDLTWVTDARPQGYERLIHLFIYNYERPWPTEFDYRPILTGFVVVVMVALGLAALRQVRRQALTALFGACFLFTAWCVDLYMPDLSPHWSLQHLIATYYDHRDGPEQPILAFQMNWKGENFYTGNRVHAFVDLETEKLRDWAQENEGRTFYVMSERSRLGSFRAAVGPVHLEELTGPRDSNKFILFRGTIGQANAPDGD